MSPMATVTIGAKRTQEYVLSVLSCFNRGADQVELVALGDCIGRAAEVARSVKQEFGARMGDASISELRRGERRFTAARMKVGFSPERAVATAYPADDFVRFPIYHLLFDHLLASEGSLVLGDPAIGARLLEVRASDCGLECTPGEDLLQLMSRSTSDSDKKMATPLDRLTSALYRSGFVLSDRWAETAAKLESHDDVVLGLDTNILLDCVVTQQLLDSLAFSCQADCSPSWILLVVPNTVMHELEQAVNARDERGLLSEIGRKGYRALQEILELDQSRDLRGVSLLIVGDVDPVLDARVELRALREDFKRANAKERIQFSRKESVGDALIRDQFRSFLRQVSFHKSAYFLTADKSNSALAQAEGLHSLYFAPAYSRRTIGRGEILRPPQVEFGDERLSLNIPFGKLLYELAVQFGSVVVGARSTSIRLDCDLRGESLEHWSHRDLRIQLPDLRRLLELYKNGARVPLAQAESAWLAEYRRAAA